MLVIACPVHIFLRASTKMPSPYSRSLNLTLIDKSQVLNTLIKYPYLFIFISIYTEIRRIVEHVFITNK